ncbi:hypothetical protein DOFOFD_01800 [Acetobacteraceae bacterium EV16P]|uniref:STAS domain-containing protein n=2 Tax=Sorlinia euscelidii TaxID=3081148 RepID=A0ABU7U0L8_9PROT
MTAGVVDEHTDTHGNQRMECTGLGVSNMLVAAFGGIGGCGMVGQTVGNLRYGGRGRLSTFAAGAFLLLLMDVLHRWFALVPLAALVAIMIMVSVSTFAWGSLRDLMRHPKLSTVVMIVTVLVTVSTQDLAAGVVAGVLLSGVFFAWRATNMLNVKHERAGDEETYEISGQIFFASSDMLFDAVDFQTSAKKIVIDVDRATFWDITAVAKLEKIVSKLQARGVDVEVKGLRARQHDIIAEQSDEPLLAV